MLLSCENYGSATSFFPYHSSAYIVFAILSWRNGSHDGIVSLNALFSWEKGFSISFLHLGCENFVSLLAFSFNTLVSWHGASGVTHVMGPTATGVVGGGNSGDEYLPAPWCAGVVRLGDKFPSLILEMECREDMLRRMALMIRSFWGYWYRLLWIV